MAAWLWARSDIRHRWASLAMLAALIAISLGSVCALVAGSRQADTAFERYLAHDHLPDILVSTESSETADRLQAMTSDPRIARIERAEMTVVAPAPMEPGNAGFAIVAQADTVTGGLGLPRLVAGRYPNTASPDEIMVNERAAKRYGFRPGQRVPLRALRCYECDPEPVGDATIVGVVRLATDLIEDPQLTGLAIAGPKFLDGRWEQLARPGSWIGIHARSREDVAPLVAELSVQVTDGDAADTRIASGPLARAGRWQRNALAIAAGIVTLAGLLVVTQGVARHLGGRPHDAGALTAMGLGPRQATAAGVLATLPAVAGGAVGGVALAVLLSPLLPRGVVRRADPDIGVRVDTTVLCLGVLVALLVTAGVTWLVARRWAGSRRRSALRTPSMTMRVATDAGLRPVPATGAHFATATGRGGTRLPVLPTIAVLAAATAVVTGALVVRWSLDGLIDDADRYGQGYDLRVSLPDDASGAARQLAADPRVEGVTLTSQGGVDLVGRNGETVQVATTGVQSVSGVPPIAMLHGRAPAGPREIALASATAAALGLHQGDHTTARGQCGEVELVVVGRVIVPLTSSNFPDDGSVLTMDGFEQLCASENVASIDVNTSALVQLRDRHDLEAVREDWTARGFPISDREIPNTIGLVRELRPVPVIVAAVVGLLALAAVAHTLLTTVRRRRHDLAVLRAFGLRPRQAGRIITWQAATLATLALVVGIPFGLVLGRQVWSVIARSSNVVVRVDVQVLGLAVLAAAVAAILLALSVWPARRASRLRPAETLRAE